MDTRAFRAFMRYVFPEAFEPKTTAEDSRPPLICSTSITFSSMYLDDEACMLRVTGSLNGPKLDTVKSTSIGRDLRMTMSSKSMICHDLDLKFALIMQIQIVNPIF